MITTRKFMRLVPLAVGGAALALACQTALAQEFEVGMRYSERQVNAILRRFHDDVAALRRYLVDEEFLSRESGRYWRSGGTV